MPVPIDSFVYNGFSVQKAIGEVPKLDFEIKINTVRPEDVPNIKYIYINHLECEVDLCSTSESEYASGYSGEGNLGTYTISLGRLFEVGKHRTSHLIIPLTSPKVDKFLEIRHKKKYLMFKIKMSGYCLCYDSEHKLTEEIPLKGLTLKKRTTTGELSELIFNTDDFIKLMKEIKGYNLESIEIPIYEFKEQSFPSMKKAVKLLNSAHQNLSSGKELETAKDIRNLLESITEKKMVSTDEGKKPRKFLSKEIKKRLLRKVPESSKETYKKVIKGLQKDIRSIYSVLSVFIHEADNNLIAVPFHRDLEFLYLSTLAIITYLAKNLE